MAEPTDPPQPPPDPPPPRPEEEKPPVETPPAKDAPSPLPFFQRYAWVPWVVSGIALPTAVIGNCAQRDSVEVARESYRLAKDQADLANRRWEEARREEEQRRADAGPEITGKLQLLTSQVGTSPDGGRGGFFRVRLEVVNRGATEETISGASLGLGNEVSGPVGFVYANGQRFGLNERLPPNAVSIVDFTTGTLSPSAWKDTVMLGRKLPDEPQFAVHFWLYVKTSRGVGFEDVAELPLAPDKIGNLPAVGGVKKSFSIVPGASRKTVKVSAPPGYWLDD